VFLVLYAGNSVYVCASSLGSQKGPSDFFLGYLDVGWGWGWHCLCKLRMVPVKTKVLSESPYMLSQGESVLQSVFLARSKKECF
jgi:hypothetical protein